MRTPPRAVVALLAMCVLGCEPYSTILSRNIEGLIRGPARLDRRITDPARHDARLAVLWVGHATVLVQIDDRFVLTDPVFTDTVGQLSPRLVEPGLSPEALPRIDAAVVSHMHFDHLSLGTLDRIESRVSRLYVPRGGLVYVPRYAFARDEVEPWHTVDLDGLRITAVPVRHEGFRYGVDAEWMHTSYTGWVIEHRGLRVFFAGDTAYDPALFVRIRERIGPIDLALLPIGPVEPRSFTERSHIDGDEALQVLEDVGAQVMIPIHYDTFAHGMDPPGGALARLREAMARRGVEPSRVRVLALGEQAVIVPRRAEAAP